MIKIIASMIVCLSCALSFCAGAGDTLEEDRALDLLIAKIQVTDIYKKRLKIECLRFAKTSETKKYFEFKVYENHVGKNCSGDSATVPTVDRFRVLKRSEKIMLYQTVADKFVPFGDVLSKK